MQVEVNEACLWTKMVSPVSEIMLISNLAKFPF